MPRKAKPARLWLKPGDADRAAMWVILDKGRKVSTGCREQDLAGAERELARYTGEKYDPRGAQARGLDLPIAEVIAVYLREQAIKAKRADFLIYTAESTLRWWGDKTLADVRLKTCEDYVTWRRAEGVGIATARHDLKTLRTAIHYWHDAYGPLPAMPKVTLPAAPKGRIRWLTRSEMARLLWAARRRHQAQRRRYHNTRSNEPYTADSVMRALLLGVYTGSRPGAVLALSWVPSTVGGWIDIENGVIYRRGEAEDETLKRRPIVRIHSRLLPFLRAWRDHDLKLGIVSVIHHQGERVAKLRRSWKGAVADAGLGTYQRGPRGRDRFVSDVSPHVLRHTCVTWQLQAGVDPWEVAGFVGMSVDTLIEVYGHHSPDYQSKAANSSNKRPRG
jgi:hypothetical protein